MPTVGAWQRYRRAAFRLLGIALVLLVVVTTSRTCMLESEQVAPATDKALPQVDEDAPARLAAALRFPTVSATAAEPETQRAFEQLEHWLDASFPRVHQELELDRFELGRLYHWRGRDPSLDPILLTAHLDVVPVETGTQEAWTHPPFAGVVDDEFIWGRGAIDDKASAVAILEAVEHLLDDGFVPARSVYLAFGHDEEVGGEQGAARIAGALAQHGVTLHFVLDEGGVMVDSSMAGTDHDVALIGVAEKGYATAELTVELDEGGHSSMPPAHTAVGIVSEAISRLEQSPMPARVRSPTDAMLRTLAPHMSSAARRYALANLWLFEPLLVLVMEAEPAANASLRTTQAATITSGGTAENVLPTRARGLVNFRIAPGDTVEDVRRHVQAVVDDLDVQVRILPGAREPTPVSDQDSQSYRALAATIRQIHPQTVVAPYLTIGGTDARHYQPLAHAAFRFLPVRLAREDRSRVHGNNERIAIDQYFDAIRFYMALLMNA